MKKIFHYILILFCLFSAQALLAQTTEKDSLPPIVEVDGANYYQHPIQKGNTLYSISKKYLIPIDGIKAANTAKWKEMRIGDTLLIPVKAIQDFQEDQEQLDGNFIIHEVQKKNTLYSIAKEYNLEINEVLLHNPRVEEEGLKKGMKLRIPVAQIKAEPRLDEYHQAEASPYITHRVMPKETLYSLSKNYNVGIDSILSVNTGLEEGLKVNQLINIPILREFKDTTKVELVFDSSAVKSAYEICLLLPFYADEMGIAEDTTPSISKKLYEKLFSKSKYAIEFYQGFLMAADSMKSLGMNLKLKVFDTAHDTARVRKMIEDSLLNNADLIVGPLFYKEFMLVADFAKKQQINIVSPVKQSNRILLGNEYVSKVISSDPVLLRYMGTYAADSLSQENLLMVYPDHFKERNQAEILRKSYTKRIASLADTNLNPILKEIFWDPEKQSEFKSRLDTSRMNVLLVPTNDQPFVTRLLTSLNMVKDYKFMVLGMESWKDFDNIEVDYLQNLGVHLVVTEYLDYEKEQVIDFSKRYLSEYHSAPGDFSYLGFDVGNYYLRLMDEYGLNFKIMLLGYQDQFLAHKFEFFKTGIESGYENLSVFMIRYQDYSVLKMH